MPFISMPGLEGKVYVPDTESGMRKKHPCADCFSCQMCGDDRCEICRCQKRRPGSARHCEKNAKKMKSEGA